MKPAPCPEKRDLIGAYQLATRKYSEAVASLNQNMGICGRDRYDAFHSLAEEARKLAHEAEQRMDKHVAEHSC
jgi:hypothetical protein